MRSRSMGLAILGAAMGLWTGTADAALIIVPNGGAIDTAQAEPQLAGGTGFPIDLFGHQHPARLEVDSPGWYRFTYIGAGNAGNTNTFMIGANSFSAVGPGGTGAGSSLVNSFFDVYFAAAGLIPFTYTTDYAAPDRSIARSVMAQIRPGRAIRATISSHWRTRQGRRRRWGRRAPRISASRISPNPISTSRI